MKKTRVKKKTDSLTKFDGLYQGDTEKIFKVFKKISKRRQKLTKNHG